MGVIKEICYYEDEGPHHLDETIERAVARAVELGIEKLVVFTKTGEGALKAASSACKHRIKVIAASFAVAQKLRDKTKEDAPPETVGIADPVIRGRLKEHGVEVISGDLPFQDLFIPGAADVKLMAIGATLDLLAGGLRFCVQAVIMATEAGYVDPGEDVVAMAADVAIVATGSYKLTLFSPFTGMQIREIICKPRNLTLTKPGEIPEEEDEAEVAGEVEPEEEPNRDDDQEE